MSDLDWRYVPTAYLDEVTPAPRRSPNDWLFLNFDQAWLEGPFATGPGDLTGATFLEEGDEIEFDRVASLGVDTLAVNADGTWSLTAPEPACPDEATGLWVYETGNADFSEASAQDLVHAICDSEELPYTCGITFAAWDKTIRTYKFDGTGFIEQVPV